MSNWHLGLFVKRFSLFPRRKARMYEPRLVGGAHRRLKWNPGIDETGCSPYSLFLKRSHRLPQTIRAERLDVVAAIKRRGIGNRAAAQAAARLPQRGVLALLQPVAHVGQHSADVLDAVNMQRRG